MCSAPPNTSAAGNDDVAGSDAGQRLDYGKVRGAGGMRYSRKGGQKLARKGRPEWHFEVVFDRSGYIYHRRVEIGGGPR